MTTRKQLVGQIQRPGQKPENIVIVSHERPLLTSDEQAAGLQWVDGRYDPGDIRRYGAVLDGTTDDTGAVTDWINVGLQSVPLTHPGGTALLSTWTQIAVSTDLHIRGYADAQLKATSAKAFLQPAGGDIDIEGIEFNTWLNIAENDAGDTGTTDKMRFHNCKFDTIAGIAIDHERPINSCWITNNKFKDCSIHAVRIGNNTYANQDTWQKIVITENECKNLSATGSSTPSFCLIYGKEVIIERNLIDGIVGDAGAGNWGIYTKMRHGSVSFNVINDVDANTGTDIVGINIKGTTRGVTTSPQGFSNVVIGNRVRNIGTAGTDGTGIKAQTDDVLISGNLVEDSGLSGITMDEAVGSENIKIVHNTIRFTTATNTVALRIATGGQQHVISENIVTNAQTGVRFSPGTSAGGTNYIFDNNQFDITGSAFSVFPTDTLDNVTISNNKLLAGTYGYINNGGAGSMTRWEFIDNDFENASTAMYSSDLPGDCKIVQRVHAQTTDATSTVLISVTLPDNSAFRCDWDVMGMESDGSDRAVYSIGGLFYRDGGTATQQGSDWANFTAIESDATWTGADLDVNSNNVRCKVQGVASQTINWSCELTARSID